MCSARCFVHFGSPSSMLVRFFISLMLCCTLFLVGCGAPVDGGVAHDRAVGEYPLYDAMEGRGASVSAVDDAYRLGAEDRLRIHVFGEDDLSNS